MKLTTPRWWYVRDRAPGFVMRHALRPLSWIWAAATARRMANAEPFAPGVPVISVGNLTVGGSGKTPVVREVVARLRAKGVNAVGLSRGYGGRLEGPHRVDTEVDTAADVGDEPLMLARDGDFWIARDRAAGARATVDAGAQTIVLDDGHQNPALKKALSLVVVDGETRDNAWPFGDGAVFPSGPMREPFGVGLARADAVVLLLPVDLPEPDPDLLHLLSSKPVLIARLEPAEPPPSGPQVGFAGIAKPWKVEQSLKAAGAQLEDFIPFPDHQAYSEGDLRFIERRAAVYGAGMVTTEKDWVRLSPDWRAKVKAWPVRARFEDEAALEALLSQPRQ
ncbi:MAG TPA: tetraacyldisaccharide 4'-kinase [Caulobacteraceae bacterium]|jgi:tetraacyldisaccharide 4'-kinase|nr:tetraacyldisaccharide 4'-kinase [Caulobacteraceae bacterium]